MTNISIQRLNRWIEKAFNIKGGPTLVDVESAIRTVYVIQDGVETRAHQGWNRYAFGTTTAAVAAQFGAVQLRNPAGSNVVGVVERATYVNGAADSAVLILKAGAIDFATPVVSQRADPRGQLLPTLVATKGAAAAQSGGVVEILGSAVSFPNADFVTTINNEIVVAPGDAITIWDNTVNVAFNAMFVWRERALETSELTG